MGTKIEMIPLSGHLCVSRHVGQDRSRPVFNYKIYFVLTYLCFFRLASTLSLKTSWNNRARLHWRSVIRHGHFIFSQFATEVLVSSLPSWSKARVISGLRFTRAPSLSTGSFSTLKENNNNRTRPEIFSVKLWKPRKDVRLTHKGKKIVKTKWYWVNLDWSVNHRCLVEDGKLFKL